MNVRRSSLFSAVLVLALAAGLLVVATAQVRPKPEKLCPITFHLEPTTLQAGYSEQIERVNALLAQDLVGLRRVVPFKDEDALLAEAKKFKDHYAGTYLAFPVLWDEKGVAHTGWPEILAYLATVLPKATFIQPQAVNVYMEYIPLQDRNEVKFKDRLAKTLVKRIKPSDPLWFNPGDIDFLASIRTVLAYAPYDDPIVIGNEDPSPHQNVCDPIF